MAVEERKKRDHELSDYETVQVSDLRISRRGKHHELLGGILDALTKVADGSAVVIPLNSVGEVSLGNLRSAVTRSARNRGISVTTYSDEANFYVWKKVTDGSKGKKSGGRKKG